MPFILAGGTYRFTPQDKWVEVDGTLSLRLYQGGWVEVPLLTAGVVVSQATLDGHPLPLYNKDDQYHFMARGAGDHVLKLRYNVPLSTSGATRSFAPHLPAASVSNASMTIEDASARLSSSPAIPMSTSTQGGRVLVSASIPQSEDVTLAWTSEKANPLLHGHAHHEKPLIQANADVLVTVSDKTVRTHAILNCSILRNETASLTIDIPTNADVAALQCPKLDNYNVTDDRDGRRVHLNFSEPVSGQEAIDLTIEQPLANINSAWEAPVIALEEAQGIKGALGVEASGGIEVSMTDRRDVRPLDVRELPAEVASMASSPVLLAFEYHKQPYHLALSSQKGEEVAVLTATIDTADGLTLMTPEGKVVTRVTYSVRNNLKQSLALKLPSGATLWSAYVNGDPAKPVKTSDGGLKVPLLRSQSMAPFPVEITFVSDQGAERLSGQRTMQAPEVDLPVSQMTWAVYLPKSCDVVRFGGTMQPATEDLPRPPVTMGAVATVPNPEPAMAQGAAMSRAETARDKSEVDEKTALKDMVSPARQGAFPVQVFVPQVGHAYRFSSLMVAGGMPTVTITYTSVPIEGLGWALLGLMGLGAGTFVARRYHWGARLADVLQGVRGSVANAQA
jgi:hypothetical protein